MSTYAFYGGRQFRSKLSEKPFFVETGSITAKSTPIPYFWKFSANPIVCEVYNESLEKISIFLFHVCNFCVNDMRNSCPSCPVNPSSCPAILCAFDKLFEKIIAEMSTSMKFENCISVFNILTLMNVIFRTICPSILMNQDSEQFMKLCGKIEKLQGKFQQDNLIENRSAIPLIDDELLNLLKRIKNAIDLTKHKNLKIETDIFSEMKDLYFHSYRTDLKNTKDSFYQCFSDVSFIHNDEKAIITSKTRTYDPAQSSYKRHSYRHYSSSNGFLSKCEENSLNSKDNVDNLKQLFHVRRNSLDSIEITNDGKLELANKFLESFNYRKKKRNDEREFIILNENEVIFTCEYITELIVTLNECLERNITDLKNIIPANLKLIVTVINSMRYTELQKPYFYNYVHEMLGSLYLLLENEKLNSLKLDLPINLLFILTKINFFINMDAGNYQECYDKEPRETINLIPVRYIESVENIPIERRSLWKNKIVSGWTAQEYLDRYTQYFCTVCMNELDSSSFCLLVCGHAFCHNCIFVVSDPRKSHYRCPLCRSEFKEVLSSQFIEILGKGLESV